MAGWRAGASEKTMLQPTHQLCTVSGSPLLSAQASAPVTRFKRSPPVCLRISLAHHSHISRSNSPSRSSLRTFSIAYHVDRHLQSFQNEVLQHRCSCLHRCSCPCSVAGHSFVCCKSIQSLQSSTPPFNCLGTKQNTILLWHNSARSFKII